MLADLLRMIPLLARLYGDTTEPEPLDLKTPANPDEQRGGPQEFAAQGRTIDPDLRRKIELRSEDHAVEHFTRRGWIVRRVGHLKLGYDLECIKANGTRLHVEVKGTRTVGDRILLTANEVLHVRHADQRGA